MSSSDEAASPPVGRCMGPFNSNAVRCARSGPPAYALTEGPKGRLPSGACQVCPRRVGPVAGRMSGGMVDSDSP
jgi:hypothetical protein